MSRASLFHWVYRWFWGGVITMGLFATAVVVVNVIDGLPFWLALRRARQLDAPALQAIADACSRYERAGYQRRVSSSIPAEFQALKPVRVSIYPGCSDIALFEQGDAIYVFLRVDTYPDNQVIRCVSSGHDRQHADLLWERNPEVTRRFNPLGRIVTVRQSDMHSAREWIVRADELLVIDRKYTTGQADRIVVQVPLTPDLRTTVQSALALIGPDIRGHAFDAGADDGVSLHVSFGPKGSGDDILLRNAWRDELRPLVDAITQLVGTDYAIEFPNIVQRQTEQYAAGGIQPAEHVVTMNLREYNRRRNRIPLAWWRLWPRFDIEGR